MAVLFEESLAKSNYFIIQFKKYIKKGGDGY